MKVLVIEDTATVASVIKKGLEKSDIKVDVAGNGRTGLDMARNNIYDVIVLDIMLPEMDGWTVCEQLRESRYTMPILMLTARDAVDDKVRGLDSGADDYLPKPFDFNELLARIRALARRSQIHKSKVIKVVDLVIDTGAHRVTRAGREINLTPREYTLLEALAANEGRVLSREVIQERVWQDEDSYSNTVDVFIKTLRKKVDADFDVKLIQTVYGLGYALRAPDAVGA